MTLSLQLHVFSFLNIEGGMKTTIQIRKKGHSRKTSELFSSANIISHMLSEPSSSGNKYKSDVGTNIP